MCMSKLLKCISLHLFILCTAKHSNLYHVFISSILVVIMLISYIFSKFLNYNKSTTQLTSPSLVSCLSSRLSLLLRFSLALLASPIYQLIFQIKNVSAYSFLATDLLALDATVLCHYLYLRRKRRMREENTRKMHEREGEGEGEGEEKEKETRNGENFYRTIRKQTSSSLSPSSPPT